MKKSKTKKKFKSGKVIKIRGKINSTKKREIIELFINENIKFKKKNMVGFMNYFNL